MTANYGYFAPALIRAQRKPLLAALIALLTPQADSFDAIAFRGLSGAMIGPALADHFDKRMIVVRKPSDGVGHHSDCPLEEFDGRYIIVDDFICSGTTVDAVKTAVDSECRYVGSEPPQLVAVLLYCGTSGTYDGETYNDVPVWRVETRNE